MSGPAHPHTVTSGAGALRDRLAGRVEELLAVRAAANELFFDACAEQLARLCHRVAERFSRGGRLIALGDSPQARSDAHHVAVEFVHPVIVGKRALPAIALGGGDGGLRERVELIAGAQDIVLAFGREPDTLSALSRAARCGCLTVAFEQVGAECELVPAVADPLARQELIETAYHLLWELVHVFFEHRCLLEGGDARSARDPGASSFLYPFLTDGERDLEGVIADVRRSISMKAQETGVLRAQTLTEGGDTLLEAAVALRRRFDAGASMLVLGNGGSATDAMDAVADFAECPGAWVARPAIALTDASIFSAIANDVGVESVFRRQVIAYGRPGDVLLAFSTSGDSLNVIEALLEGRARGLLTLAMAGYGGGRIAAKSLADHVLVSRSQHIPRIQEAQASASHVLRTLVEEVA